MNPRRRVKVLVIGGGPAGSVAASALAGQGIETLLVDRDDVAGPGHGVLLGPAALRSLPDWRSTRHGAELWFDPQTRHVLPDAGYSVVDSGWLRSELRTHATAAGAGFLRGRATAPVAHAHGFEVVVGQTIVEATHVVLATGAAELTGQGTGLACARRFTGSAGGDRVLLRLLPPPVTEPRGRPRYAWLVPESEGSFTVGGMTLGEEPGGPDALGDTAFAALTEIEPALATSRPAGPLMSAPVACGFSPAGAAGADGLRIGDAAGLANPFTGEGVSSAIHSGTLVAQAIAAHVDDPAAARRAFAGLLSAAFVGYFETARHAARRYHLAWRVLAASASSETTFYAKARRAILLSAGEAELTVAEPVEVPADVAAVLVPFSVAADEIAVRTVRDEWPFLARLFTAGAGGPVARLRPASLVLAGILAGGGRPRRGHPAVAAALDLAMLGTLAFLGPAAEPREGRGVDWASATTVLAGDYLLGHATRLVAEAAPEISWTFSDWLTELASLRAEALAADDPGGAERVSAALFEFPARVGAHLGQAADEVVDAVRGYGAELGKIILYTEDVLALRGERTRFDTTLPVMLAGRCSALPALLGRADVTAAALAEPRLREAAFEALAEAEDTAWRAMSQACSRVPHEAARAVLRAMAESAAAPPGNVRL